MGMGGKEGMGFCSKNIILNPFFLSFNKVFTFLGNLFSSLIMMQPNRERGKRSMEYGVLSKEARVLR